LKILFEKSLQSMKTDSNAIAAVAVHDVAIPIW
jgi:hypothetical protein